MSLNFDLATDIQGVGTLALLGIAPTVDPGQPEPVPRRHADPAAIRGVDARPL